MDSELRKQKLAEIKLNNHNVYMTGIRILYEGEIKTFDAYKIPLDYLIYNKYNGRIGSLVKSFEAQHHILDAEDPRDKKLIEQFLWDLKMDKNKATEKSLVTDGQQKYGIVTNDGIIIDGISCAFLLRKIYSEREIWEKNIHHHVDHCQYFIAVILPEGANPKEVSKLETIYQMGEDEKLDYNPIEKYLKCYDLKNQWDFSIKDIADMMGESVGQIKEWLEIMDLMNDYLDSLSYDHIYTRLDKREGQFVDLNKYIKKYKKGTTNVDWNYSEVDIADLKSVCFDYIRAEYEGKEFRYIARPDKNESIFCKGDVWKPFLGEHEVKVESVNEKLVDELREENPDADLTKLLQARDEDWQKKVENHLRVI